MHTLFIFLIAILFQSVSSDDPRIYIFETEPPIDPISGTIIAMQDQDVQLSCSIENMAFEVYWAFQATRGNSSLVLIATGTRTYDAFRWAIDKPHPTTWRLRVQNVQVTDEGVYTCMVQVVEKNYMSVSREIRVLKVPQILDLDTSNDMIKNADDSAKLECYANGIPKPLIKWSRMAGELMPNGGREYLGNVLSIERIQSRHAGIYKCFAENSAGRDFRVIRVTVNFRPEIYTGTPVMKQAIGYSKALICNIKGYPAPTPEQIAWSKEGRPVIPNSRIEIHNIPGASNKITSILVIKNIRQSDYGRYQCSGENEKGSRYVTMELQSSLIQTPERTGQVLSGVSPFHSSLAVLISVAVTVLLAGA